jgi:hypothetical protein
MNTAIAPNTTASAILYPFTIDDRILHKKGVKRGVATVSHLEEVRDYLRKLATLQDPVDYHRSLDQLHVSFSEGRMYGEFINPEGLSEKLLFSSNGASQTAKEVLPPHFFSGLKTLAHMNEAGEKLATLNWYQFRGDKSKPRQLRSILMKDVDGKVRRMIRSCHSQDYSTYSNLQFVEDLLSVGTEVATMPVLDVTVSDSVMRLRFTSDEVQVNKPVRMFEAWNSEVGRRRVGLRGGMFKLVCTNGMGHWSDAQEFHWRHYGDSARIRQGVLSAVTNLKVVASEVLQAYNNAAQVAIDNAYLYLEQELRTAGVSSERVDKAKGALNHETTTVGNNLASCVDAMTLIAQDETDVLVQDELERMAADLLHRGLAKAARDGNRLFAHA